MEGKTEKKYTLFEVVFILSIVLVILSSFSLLNIFSKQNYEFTKKLATSTKLAQEGIIAIMSMQNTDLTKNDIALPPCANLKDPTINCGDFILSACDIPSKYCLKRDTSSYTSPLWKVSDTEESSYFRKVRITQENNKKEMTILIWWIDEQGLHKTALTRELNKGKNN